VVLDEPEAFPLGTDDASVLHPDVSIIVQHIRPDSRQRANARTTLPSSSDSRGGLERRTGM
jgi:hypothetical protein